MDLVNFIKEFQATFLVLLSFALVFTAYRFMYKRRQSTSPKIKWQISLLCISLGFIVFTILSLPIPDGVKGQIIGFLGIVISAAFALSSTTLLGNLLAGIMNNSSNSYKVGDFVIVGEYIGRVTIKSLFHTEIQTADRNLVTLPNLFISQQAIKVIRESGTIISSTVSIGYDVSKGKVEKGLIAAAESIGLKSPFVFIEKLGDFSVLYKIHGLLETPDIYFTSLSQLNEAVIQCLHDLNIEIVSPTFMNQRQVNGLRFISKENSNESSKDLKEIDEMLFDKAIKAEEIEEKHETIKKIEEKIELIKDSGREKSGKKDSSQIEKLEILKTTTIDEIEIEKKTLEQL